LSAELNETAGVLLATRPVVWLDRIIGALADMAEALG
jgi:hypothetical protein